MIFVTHGELEIPSQVLSPSDKSSGKLNNTFIDNSEMPIYYLLQYSSNYSIAWESLWNYYRDRVNDDANENNTHNSKINNIKIIKSKSFEYKTKVMECTSDDHDDNNNNNNNNNNSNSNNNDNINTLDTEVVAQVKYLRNFFKISRFYLQLIVE